MAAVVGGVGRRVGVCVGVRVCVCRGGFLAGTGKLDLFFFKGCRRIGGGGAGFSNSTSLYFIHLRWKKMKIFSEHISVCALSLGSRRRVRVFLSFSRSVCI